jgi:hypothetical protein
LHRAPAASPAATSCSGCTLSFIATGALIAGLLFAKIEP